MRDCYFIEGECETIFNFQLNRVIGSRNPDHASPHIIIYFCMIYVTS